MNSKRIIKDFGKFLTEKQSKIAKKHIKNKFYTNFRGFWQISDEKNVPKSQIDVENSWKNELIIISGTYVVTSIKIRQLSFRVECSNSVVQRRDAAFGVSCIVRSSDYTLLRSKWQEKKRKIPETTRLPSAAYYCTDNSWPRMVSSGGRRQRDLRRNFSTMCIYYASKCFCILNWKCRK